MLLQVPLCARRTRQHLPPFQTLPRPTLPPHTQTGCLLPLPPLPSLPQGSQGMAGVLAHPLLTYLGTISFPIFILHGAIGQLFYKKVRHLLGVRGGNGQGGAFWG